MTVTVHIFTTATGDQCIESSATCPAKQEQVEVADSLAIRHQTVYKESQGRVKKKRKKGEDGVR